MFFYSSNRAIRDGKVHRALLVTQKDLLGTERALAPPGVEPVVDQLPERLAALAAPTT